VAIQYTDTLDRTFHALGDASRRRMLAALGARGACSAGELGELFDSTQPTVSRHLRVLEEAELVRRQIVGRRHLFSLAPERVQEARSWMDRHLAFWEAAFDQLEELLESPHGKANE
jgi:DNA-binding transcriptional ArsR family regulator